MPLDAFTLRALAAELEGRCVGMKIDRVAMPTRDEIVLVLRGRAGGGRLLLSANSASPRACMAVRQRENPSSPPMFCMLLRKLIGGGVIRGVTQPPAERILEFEIEASDELGELRRLRLVLEMISRRANLVLVDEEGRITDAIRRVDGDLSTGKRQVLPGLYYRPPEAREGIDPFEADAEEIRRFAAEIPAGVDPTDRLLHGLRGLSPLVCRELAHRAGEDRERLAELIEGLRDTGASAPWLVLKDGAPKDFSAIEITQYGSGWDCVRRESFSALLEEFFGEREQTEQVRSAAREMTGVVTTTLERTRRKLAVQRRELDEARDRERLRENGDLLMANLHLIGRGASRVTVSDFYSEEGTEREITLDPKLNPQQNAARCYREYARRKNAEKMLTGLIGQGEREEQYLGSVLDELRRAESRSELDGIRAELVSTGYLRRSSQKHGGRERQKAQPPREFVSSGGFRIQVGRNNLQNDELTLRQSHKNDVWLHAQHSHGAHVLIRCANDEPDDATYTEAAMLAAYYSEARGGSGVAVDYTRARYVKKPAGARPGMVVYDPYYTMYVTPNEETVRSLAAGGEKNR